ncbi:hypothetical protein YB2330_006148 [Saitoella coloradoensis]
MSPHAEINTPPGASALLATAGACSGSSVDDPLSSAALPTSIQKLAASNDQFNVLLSEIHKTLLSHPDPAESPESLRILTELMSNYSVPSTLDSSTPAPTPWQKYMHTSPYMPYTRNLIYSIPNVATLLILVWNPAKGSAIHDHAGAHCLMKILSGQLEERVFEWPSPSSPTEGEEEQNGEKEHEHEEHTLSLKSSRVLEADQVAYISDTIGLHRITNPSPEMTAVSLHLYWPPWAAMYGCRVYDEKTGRGREAGQAGFYSVGGEKVTGTK